MCRPICLTHCSPTVVSNHKSWNPITSASYAYLRFIRFHRSSSIPSVSTHQCREAFASLWHCRKLKECQCRYRSQSARVVRQADRRGTARSRRSVLPRRSSAIVGEFVCKVAHPLPLHTLVAIHAGQSVSLQITSHALRSAEPRRREKPYRASRELIEAGAVQFPRL